MVNTARNIWRGARAGFKWKLKRATEGNRPSKTTRVQMKIWDLDKLITRAATPGTRGYEYLSGNLNPAGLPIDPQLLAVVSMPEVSEAESKLLRSRYGDNVSPGAGGHLFIFKDGSSVASNLVDGAECN